MKIPCLILFILLFCLTVAAQNPLTLVGQYDGEGEENYFGVPTSFGDFDDDGREEFIIGALGWNNYTGKNYYYNWIDSWPLEPAFTFQGTMELHNYGGGHNLGDINGDSIVDFGLTDIRYGENARLDLLWGSSDFDSIADWSMWSVDFIYEYGGFLDSTGDVNGDGGNDFMFHMTVNTDNYSETRIYYGGSVLDTIPDWTLSTPIQYCYPLGDINADGFTDIMIPDNPVKIFFGGSEMDTIPDMELYDYAWTGRGIGDINGDGYDDMFLAMRFPDSTYTWDCVYFGGPDLDDEPDVLLLDWYGERSASFEVVSGDFNGDGYNDIACTSGYLGGNHGVQIYLGSPWFNPIPDALVLGWNEYNFGEILSCGDVNGDGRDELLITAQNYPWFEIGRVYLYTGPEEWIDYGAGVEPNDLAYSPGRYKLYQNYPNPFNSSTTIRFELGKISTVMLSIYDLSGRLVRTIIDSQNLKPGGYNVSWNARDAARDAASGIYLLSFQVDDYREYKKMVVVK